MRFVLIVLVSVLLAACSKPKIDASSDEAAKNSIHAVRQSLNDNDRKEFDALILEVGTTTALAGVFSKDAISLAAIMQPMNGMNGEQVLAFQRAKKAEAAEREKKDAAEQEVKEREELQGLLSQSEKSKETVANISVANVSVKEDGKGFSKQVDLTADVTNGTGAALKSINFTYNLKSQNRSVPWDSGDGFFSIDGGLEQGETRKLSAISEQTTMFGFIVLQKAMKEHPDAALAVVVTDARGADNMSVVRRLSDFEQKRLATLQAKYSKKN